jgi:KDO2-lipid IV(A) lauroyltransferase
MRLLLAFLWLVHWLPLPVLGRLGEAFGSLLYRIMTPRRDITLTNLRLCMPHLSEAERVALAKQHFQAYARSIIERGVLWWASPARLQRLIKITHSVPLDTIRSEPVILLCPHFVCLDVAGAAAAMHTPGCSIYAQQKNRVFDEALRKGRSRFHPVRLVSRRDGIKPILRALREHLPFLMLPDMDFGIRDAEFVPFFGVPAATLTATARISAMTKAKVIPLIATFLPNYQGWNVTFYPAWEDYPGPDIAAATRRMNAFIEQRVLEAPAEYLWTHKRFKTRPPGEPDFYGQNTEGAMPLEEDEGL